MQVNLIWLDLSFNQITEVEGLAKLSRLQDLSLHHNQLKDIEALAETPSLVTLSLGTPCLPYVLALAPQGHVILRYGTLLAASCAAHAALAQQQPLSPLPP